MVNGCRGQILIWPSLRSWHMPHCIRSVSSEQQAQHTNWHITIPRRRPRALPRAHTRLQGESFGPCPEPTSATARFLFDYIYPRSFIRIFNSSRTIPLVGGPNPHNKGLLRRLASTLDTTQQQDSPIHGVSYTTRISPRSKYLFQWGQLWIVADISACQI